MKTVSIIPLLAAFACCIATAAAARAAEFTLTAVEPIMPFAAGTVYGYGVFDLGDVTGDGITDLVTVEAEAGTVSVHAGNGDGTFQAPVTYAVGNRPASVLLVDLDGDGHTDVVTTDSAGGTVSILYGTAGGGLTASTQFPAGISPVRAAVGDFDENGVLDIAVVDVIQSAVWLLYSDGAGGYEAPQPLLIDIDDSLDEITVADLNGDGHLDVTVPCPSQSVIAVLFGDGTGSFSPTTIYPVDSNPRYITVGLLEGADDLVDLAVCNKNSDTVSVLAGTGGGLFATPESLAAGDLPEALATMDCDGDGFADVIVANQGDGTLSLHRSLPGGGFAPAEMFSTGVYPGYLVVADVNGDGVQDVAVSDLGMAEVRVFRNDTPQTAGGSFRRGDANSDGSVNLVDAIATLQWLFAPGVLPCPDGADIDDDGSISISDPVQLIQYLFLDGSPPPAPGPLICGPDSGGDTLPPCAPSAGCP